jgi:hypothetical protein
MKGKWCATGNVFCQEISCPECNIFWEREARYKTERFRLRYGVMRESIYDKH